MRLVGYRWGLAILVGATMAAQAQDESLLILEDKPKVQVNVRGAKATPTPSPAAPQTEAPAPTPDPSEVLVAIVNSRVLTKAEINARVSSRYQKLVEAVKKDTPRVVMATDSQGKFALKNPDVNDALVQEEQLVELDRAILAEEEAAMRDWVEHSLLAEEARRQGMVVAAEEFQQRLVAAEKASELSPDKIDRVLLGLQMTRADYERSVYDALMIEKLLDMYITLNFTETQLRENFERNKVLYYEPPRHEIAHFSISLDGTESKQRMDDLRKMAEEVRLKLAAGADPDTLFDDPKYKDVQQGILGATPGWYALGTGLLPPVVEDAGRKMKVGETSRVLLQQKRDGTKIVPVSLHVVKITGFEPESGTTFETAQPAMRRALLELARQTVLARLRETNTHRVITNLTGIPAKLIPRPEDIYRAEASAQPINLKIPPVVMQPS